VNLLSSNSGNKKGKEYLFKV